MSKSRKDFLTESGLIVTGLFTGGAVGGLSGSAVDSGMQSRKQTRDHHSQELSADLVIAGGGTGGCAAALSALKMGLDVIMTDPTDWLGGQLTAQGVPPDENPWIETFGATRSYQEYRRHVRNYYRQYYPLRDEIRRVEHLDPGNGWVSPIGHEPQISVDVLESMLAPWLSNGQLTILKEHKPVQVETDGDHIRAIKVRDLNRDKDLWLQAPWFIDATEMGDVVKLGDVEYVVGSEGRKVTGEPHTPEQTNPDNLQAFNLCFFIDYIRGGNHVIDRPDNYERWRDYSPDLDPAWPGPLFSFTYTNPRTLEPRTLPFDPESSDMGWWNYRQVADPNNFRNGFYRGPITCINWPQHAYLEGKLVDEDEETIAYHLEQATELNLSLLYWLQTEAPRPDGGTGWPELRLRGDIYGTESGMAKHPYIRESRRIKARFTVTEHHVGRYAREQETGKTGNEVRASQFEDSVGIGYYNIDLHPSTGGNSYIDISSLPFQIPLGALVPERVRNLVPACKNIGTTHVTNGCYRLHPVEWNIGEAAGSLIGFCKDNDTEPHQIHESRALTRRLQKHLHSNGVRLQWPFHLIDQTAPGSP